MASSGGSSGGAPTAPIPIISAAAADSQTACQAGDGTSSPSLSRGEAAGGSGGVLASAWVHIADYAAAGPKERAAWHLRHLLEPLGRGREGEGMSVVHRTVSPQPQQQSGPATSAIGGGRRRRAGSASFSASPPPVLVGLSASNEGGLVGRGGREDVRVLSLAPSTQVFFVYQSYRVVLCLHIARSLFCFQGDTLPVELMEKALANALRALVADVGHGVFQRIDLRVTVVACDPEHGVIRTLVQDYPLSSDSLPALLKQVMPFLVGIENALVERTLLHEAHAHAHHGRRKRPHSSSAGGNDDYDDDDGSSTASTLEQLIEAGLFALQFLPATAAPALVLFTDGVFRLGRAGVAAYDDAAMQLARHDVALVVATLGRPQDPATALGYVADGEAVRVLAESTGGGLLGPADLGIVPAAAGSGSGGAAPSSSPQGPGAVARWLLGQRELGLQERLQAGVLLRYSRLNVAAAALDPSLGRAPTGSTSSSSTMSRLSSAAPPYLLSLPPSASSFSPLTTMTARARLKLYTLPLVSLLMLVELRAAEGFQATALHLSSSSSQQARGGTGERKDPSFKVLLRLSRFLDRNLAIEYTVEFSLVNLGNGGRLRRRQQQPPQQEQDLAMQQQQEAKEEGLIDGCLGSANVTVGLVGSQEWVRAVGAAAASSSNASSTPSSVVPSRHRQQLTSPSSSSSRATAAANDGGGDGVEALWRGLRRLLRALQDVDLGLLRIASLCKPRPLLQAPSPTASGGRGRKRDGAVEAEADAQQREKEVSRYHRELLQLGQLPVQEWSRWLTLAYFELLTLSGSSAGFGALDEEEDDESDEEEVEIEEDASPSPRPHRGRAASLGSSAPPQGGDEEEGGGSMLRVREDLLLTLLGRWCTLRSGRGLFLRVLSTPLAPGGRRQDSRQRRRQKQQQQEDPKAGRPQPLRFCLLKLAWASDRVVGLHLGFFGLEPAGVREQVTALERALVSANGPLHLTEPPVGYQLVLPGHGRDRDDGEKDGGGSSSSGSDAVATREQPQQQQQQCQQLPLLPLPPGKAAGLIRAYLLHRRWGWRLGAYSSASLVARMLTRSQLAAGFRLVHRSASQALLVRHVTLVLSNAPEHGGPSITRAALVQYRVLLLDDETALATELWMEPQFGQEDQPHATGGGVGVWEPLAAGCHARDRQLVSALDSFYYVRHLCAPQDALPGRLPPLHPTAPLPPPSDLNLLEVLRGAERTLLRLRFFLPVGPEQQEQQRPPSQEPAGPATVDLVPQARPDARPDPDASNRDLHALTERTLRMLLGAEIPSADLGELFREKRDERADATPGSREEAKEHGRNGRAAVLEPQAEVACAESPSAPSWSEELGLGPATAWGGGKCFAHQLAADTVSVWFLPPYRPRSSCSSTDGSGDALPLLDVTIFLIPSKHLLARLVRRPGDAAPSGALRPASSLPAGGSPLLAYIAYLHGRNFTQVAYMALRCGRRLTPGDMQEALGYCSEIGMDVDLTQLRKIALATADARRRRQEQAMVRFSAAGRRRHGRGSDGSLVAADGGRQEGEGDDKGQKVEEEVRDGEAPPLSKLADREFMRTIGTFLQPVPGTDYYYFTGSEADLLEGEEEEEEDLAMACGGGGGGGGGRSSTLSTTPHKIYLRKASSVAGDPSGAALPSLSSLSLVTSPLPTVCAPTVPDALIMGSGGGDHASGSGSDGVGDDGSGEGEGGLASLFQQGFAAEFSLMLKYIEGKRRARAHNHRRPGIDGMRRGGDAFVTPCFVRFEVVHALFGLAQSRVFRLVGGALPPSAVLPFCFDEAVKRENMWVAPRVSRQATAVSIICATHSRLDVGKFEAAVEAARQARSAAAAADAVGTGAATASGLALDEIKDLMMTTHRRFLRLVRRRVEAWAAAETVRCLLALSPLPASAVPTVLGCLRLLPAEAITRFQVTLAFVADLPGSRGDEDSDEDEGAAVGKGEGPAQDRRQAKMARGKDTGRGAARGECGAARNDGTPLLEQHEEAAVALFQEHLASCRFLPVRRVSGVYFVVEPHPPPPTSSSGHHRGGSHSASAASSMGWLAGSAASSFGSMGGEPRAPALDPAVLAACDYTVPYWAVLQVRRRRAGRRGEAAVASASLALAGRAERAGAGRWSGPYCRGSGVGGKVAAEPVVASVVDSFEVEVSLHHPVAAPWYEARERVMETVRNGVLAACAHVNRLLLLRHLHDTRLASPLLIAPSEADVRYMEEMGSDSGRGGDGGSSSRVASSSSLDGAGSERGSPRRHHRRAGAGEAAPDITPFYTGQFKCPRQLTLRFPVFHRLTPAAAIRALESTVLHPLNVANRLHTFVHRDRHGRVAYLRIESSRRKDSLTASGHGQQPPPQAQGGTGGPSAPSLTLDTAAFLSSGSTLYTPIGPGAAGSAAMGPSILFPAWEPPPPLPASSGTWVDLHVHGVDWEVGEEISVQLRCLLESRLAEIAIAQLSELLSRNPRLQLTLQDLDLIKKGTVGAAAIASGFLRGEAASSFSSLTAAGGGGAVTGASSATLSAAERGASTGGEEGNRYRAVLELPGRLLRYGDPYLFLLYLRQNTARAQFINNLHIQGAHGPSSSSLVPGQQRSLSRAGQQETQEHQQRGPGASAPSFASSSLHSPKASLDDMGAALGGGTTTTTTTTTTSTAPGGTGGGALFGSGRGIPGLTEVWAPLGADANVCHPARIGYTGPRPLEPLSAATSHPAFWSLAGGVEVELDPGLLHLYYNHNRAERKDLTTTLSARGAWLAREVGKGLALVNVRPVDAGGRVVTRLPSAVSVTQEEVDAVVAAAGEAAAGIQRTAAALQQEKKAEVEAPGGPDGGTDDGGAKPALVADIPGSCLPVAWATSVLRSLTTTTPVDGSEAPAMVPPPALAQSNAASHLFVAESGDGGDGHGSATAEGELWGVSVEVQGSVNGPPLMEWLKLCVDQALHDYFVERLLHFLKNPPQRSALAPSPPRPHEGSDAAAKKQRSTLVGRVRRAVRPIDQLVAGSLFLDSPSVRRQAAEEVLPRANVAPLVHTLCRALAQTHPFFQATLTLLHRLPSAAATSFTSPTTKAEGRALLELVDPRRLLAVPDCKDGGFALDRDAGCGEYIILCGLKVGDGALDGTGEKEKETSPSAGGPGPTAAALPAGDGGGGGGEAGPSTSRTARFKPTTEMLPPADALYPMLTAGEGATASMAALRMTNRDTACVVRVSADRQSLVLYNCHPDFAGRCEVAFQRALALAALERFVAEGIGLQKLGLLPLDLPWWRRIPGLGALVRAGPGGLKLLEAQGGALGSEGGVGLASSGRVASMVDRRRPEHAGSTTQTSAAAAAAVRGSGADSVGHSGRENQATTRTGQAEALTGVDHVKQQGQLGVVNLAGSGAGGLQAASPRKPHPGGSGGGTSGAMKLSPAMAARLRASGRALPLGSKTGPPSRVPVRIPSGGAGAPSGGRGAGAALAPSPGAGSSKNVGGGLQAPLPVRAKGAPIPTKAGSGIVPPTVLTSSSSSSSSVAVGAGGAAAAGTGPAHEKGEKDWMTAPQQWMASVLAKASPATLRACRRLSRLLRDVLPGVWALPAFDVRVSLPAAEEEGVLTGRGADPTRVHMVRLWRAALPHFQALEADAHVQALCRTWTWYQYFCFLQRQGAHLQSRVRRPLSLVSPRRRSSPSSPTEATTAVAAAAAAAATTKQQQSEEERDERTPLPLTSDDLALLLRCARWQGSWSLVLIQRSFVLPTLRRAESDPALSSAVAEITPLIIGPSSTSSGASSPVSPVVMVASPTTGPPSRPSSRSGAMTLALERRGLSGYSLRSSGGTLHDGRPRQPSRSVQPSPIEDTSALSPTASAAAAVAAVAAAAAAMAQPGGDSMASVLGSGSGGDQIGGASERQASLHTRTSTLAEPARFLSRASTVADAHTLRQLARKASALPAVALGGSVEAPPSVGRGSGSGGRPPAGALGHARSRSSEVTGVGDGGGVAALTGRRRTQLQQKEEEDGKQGRQQQREVAGHGEELLEGKEDDWLFAKSFLDRYVAHLQQALKMVVVPVAGTVSAAGGQDGDWSRLRAYLRRFVALTNTVTLVELRLSHRRLPPTTARAATAAPLLRRLNSEIRVHVSLYTVDVARQDALLLPSPSPSPPGHAASSLRGPFPFVCAGGDGEASTAAALVAPRLPTLQTFAWALPSDGDKRQQQQQHHHYMHLQLPQDVALTSAQLELATHVYDFLVEHAMVLLLGAQRRQQKAAAAAATRTVTSGALALVEDLLQKNQEPPSHSRTAIGVRYLCRPPSPSPSDLQSPPPAALLAHLQAHAPRYGLWPLHEVDPDDRGLPCGGVVGALSLATWQPLDPPAALSGAVAVGEDKSGEEGEMLVFVMTLAGAEREGSGQSGPVAMSPPLRPVPAAAEGGEEERRGLSEGEGEFRVLITHRKGKERGQRGSYVEIPGRVTRLLARTLAAAAHDHAEARVWGHVRACLAEKATIAAALSSPTPSWADAAVASSSSPFDSMGEAPLAVPMPVTAHGSLRGAGLAPSPTAQEDVSALTLAAPLGPPHTPFRCQELTALLRFSVATPLSALDEALAPLFGYGEGDAQRQQQRRQQEQIEGLPWLAVLAHLERAFWPRMIVVEGLRSGPGEADVLISCHDGGDEEQERRGLSPTEPPPHPRVLLHLSVRPQWGGAEGEAQDASDGQAPSRLRAQLLVRTSRGGEGQGDGGTLVLGERRVVEDVIATVLGFLWSRVLARASGEPAAASRLVLGMGSLML